MRRKKQRIGSDLAKVDAHVIQPHEYDEAPEWTDEHWESAYIYRGTTLIRRGTPPNAGFERFIEREREAMRQRKPRRSAR